MSNENDQLLPKEDDTQSLNKMAAQIQSLASDMNIVKAELTKKTSPDLMSAFAQMLKDALEEQKLALKAEFEQTLKNALAQQKAEFEQTLKNALAQQKAELKAELKAEFEQMLRKELDPIREKLVELDKEFVGLRMMIRGGISDLIVVQDKLDTRISKLETDWKQ